MQAHDRGRSLTVLVVSVIGKGLGCFLTLDGVFRDVFVWFPVLRGFVDVCCSALSHRVRIHLKFSKHTRAIRNCCRHIEGTCESPG
jgi:hypothetical protein